MFDELMEEPDILDCMLEIHELKEEAKYISDEKLVDTIVDYTSSVKTTPETDVAISRYFNLGSISVEDREKLENCYVLLKNYLCFDDKGAIFTTYLLE